MSDAALTGKVYNDSKIWTVPFTGETVTQQETRCESKAISVSMAPVSLKINGACHESGRVNSSIQFPPEVELHRQGLKGVCFCLCGCMCTCTHARDHMGITYMQHGRLCYHAVSYLL